MIKRVFAYYWRSITAIILILLLVGIAIIGSFQTSNQMKLVTDEELQDNWRTDYDLLVSPSIEENSDEAVNNLVRRSDMGDIRGGISLEQYQAIKEIEGITVAAPLTFLGYIQADNLMFSFDYPEDGYYVEESAVEVFDGIRYRKIADNRGTIKQFVQDGPSVLDIVEQLEFVKNGGWFINNGSAGITSRYSYYWSLMAVDPVEEMKLLNLDQAIVEGEYLPDSDQLIVSNTFELIPIILQNQSYDVRATQGIYKIDVDPNLTKEGIMELGGLEYLAQLPRDRVFHVDYNPYSEELLYYFGKVEYQDGELILEENPPQKYMPFTYVYELGEIDLQPHGELDQHTLYLASPIGVQGEQVNYRTVEQERFEKKLGFDVYGRFDPSQLHNPYVTSSTPKPADFYNPDKVFITHDLEGNPLAERVEYRNSPYKAGYTTGGADAITTLVAAEYLLGDEPISVIRVIVDGVGERSAVNLAKVEKIAAEIREKTGLHVDVMIGAADRKVQVLLDDYEGVPGYGYLLEGWSQAGASFVIGDHLSSTSLLLLSFILLIGWIALSLVYRNYVELRKKDIHVGYTFGWSKSALFKLLMKESLIVLFVVSLLLAILKLTVGSNWTKQQFGMSVIFLVVFIIFTLIFLFIIPLMRGLDKHTSLRSSGETIVGVFTRLTQGSLWGFVRNSIARYPIRTLLKFIILFMTQIYVLLFLLTKGSSSSFLILTFLGEGIELILEPYQWVLFGIGLILSLGGYIGIHINQFDRRSQEIQLYKTWGWKSRRYLGIFIVEELMISIFSVIIGAGTGYMIAKYVVQVEIGLLSIMSLIGGSIMGAIVLMLLVYMLVPKKQNTLKMFY